jgi:hypothetical protein
MTNKQTKPQQQIIQTLAKLLNEFNMDFDTFCKALSRDYVLIVNQHRKTTIRTALRCGIDRRTVAAILKNKKRYHKSSLLHIIIDEIRAKAELKNMMLPIGGTNSLASIIKDKANGSTTTNTVLDELVTMGIAEIHGLKFKFLGYPVSTPPKTTEAITAFANQFDAMVNAFIEKMQTIRNFSDS